MRRFGVIAMMAILLGDDGRDARLLRLPPTGPSRDWIVTLRGGLDPGTEAPGLLKPHGAKARHVFKHALNGFSFRGSAAAAAALARNPKVRTVVEDPEVSIVAETLTPGVKRIRARHPSAPDAHDCGFTGSGVRVAIIDTGIDLDSPRSRREPRHRSRQELLFGRPAGGRPRPRHARGGDHGRRRRQRDRRRRRRARRAARARSRR